MKRAIQTACCPWCGRRIEVGSEDPILERSCDPCGRKSTAELYAMNPNFARTHAGALAARDESDARGYGV